MHYREHRCPHCGRTNGLYAKYSLQGVRSYYSFDGRTIEENLDHVYKQGGKRLYCQACDKYVCNESEFKKKYPPESVY